MPKGGISYRKRYPLLKTPEKRKGLPPLDPRAAGMGSVFCNGMSDFFFRRSGLLLFPLSRCCGGVTKRLLLLRGFETIFNLPF